MFLLDKGLLVLNRKLFYTTYECFSPNEQFLF